MNEMTTTETPRVRALATVSDAQVQALAELLIDCVEGGASVSFMLPITRERALAFWRKVAEGVARGERVLLVAEDAEGLWAPCSSCSTSPRTSRTAPRSPRCSCSAGRGAGASARC
jgi:hypothetical protein